MKFEIIRTSQHEEWLGALHKARRYDFYHCPSYHALSIQNGSQEAILIVYTEDPYMIAMPLFFRPVKEITGLEKFAHRDATSVYGYAGPIASHEHVPKSVINGFQDILYDYLKEKNIVCVFSRLHPLLEQEQLLAGLGEIAQIGTTVSIDLTLPPDEQRSHYRKKHRQRINRLRGMGVVCIQDNSDGFLDEFREIYYETMDRVNADDYYYFDIKHLKGLLESDDLGMHLFKALYGEQVISAGLFSLCSGIVQAHLAGTKNEFLTQSPDRLVIDEVRIWAHEAGARSFHLGGGVGGREDSVFDFKAGFSQKRHDFCVWRLVVDKTIYDSLCAEKEQWNKENDRRPTSEDFFPEYRCPTSPV